MSLSIWLQASRLRTLPLALGSLAVGCAMVPADQSLNPHIVGLTLLTMLLLQVLSNVANDYGDGISGVDSKSRKGPQRVLESGLSSPEQLKKGIVTLVLLSAISGLGLLGLALQSLQDLIIFLVLGALSIIAAIAYTVGKRPYGYAALGDLAVFVFFGLVAVLGSYYLYSPRFHADAVLPAISAGLLATSVLNINNIRDIESDTKAGKRTVASLLGRHRAIIYHWAMTVSAIVGFHLYLMQHSEQALWLTTLSIPLLIGVGLRLSRINNTHDQARYNVMLKQMVLTAFVTDFLFLADLRFLATS